MFAAQACRTAMEGCFPKAKVHYTRTDGLPGGIVFHLPPDMAAIFEAQGELPAALLAAMAASGAVYYSGVRTCDPIFGRAPVFAPEPAAGTTTGTTAAAAPRFTFAEIFAGIGGFRLGLEPLGGQCVLASEMDERATATYQASKRVGR